MAGAAWATIISQFVSMVWILSYFLTKRGNHRIHLHAMRPKLSVIARITTLGLPAFMMQLANSLLNVTLNKNLLLYGGDLAISGMGIVNSLQTLLLIAHHRTEPGGTANRQLQFRAKKYDRVKTAEKLAILSATVFVLAGFLLVRFSPNSWFPCSPTMLS